MALDDAGPRRNVTLALPLRPKTPEPMRPSSRPLMALLTGMTIALPAHAFDSTTQGVVISGYATSQVTTAPFDNKLVLAAQDDAAAFVATGGRIRGARLESALRYLRANEYKVNASDLELAEAILVQ